MAQEFDAQKAAADQTALVDKARTAARNLTEKVIGPYGQSGPTSEESVRSNRAKIRSEVEWTIDELRALLDRI